MSWLTDPINKNTWVVVPYPQTQLAVFVNGKPVRDHAIPWRCSRKSYWLEVHLHRGGRWKEVAETSWVLSIHTVPIFLLLHPSSRDPEVHHHQRHSSAFRWGEQRKKASRGTWSMEPQVYRMFLPSGNTLKIRIHLARFTLGKLPVETNTSNNVMVIMSIIKRKSLDVYNLNHEWIMNKSCNFAYFFISQKLSFSSSFNSIPSVSCLIM